MKDFFSLPSFVVGIMFGALLTGAYFYSGTFATTGGAGPVSPDVSAENTPPAGKASGAISVADQSPGETVMIESVTVPPPGVWVAVREMNGTGVGNVLGAARVGGPRSGVSVPLLRATEPNRSYAVVLYRDDNGGAFDPIANSAYVDFDSGVRVVAYFSTDR